MLGIAQKPVDGSMCLEGGFACCCACRRRDEVGTKLQQENPNMAARARAWRGESALAALSRAMPAEASHANQDIASRPLEYKSVIATRNAHSMMYCERQSPSAISLRLQLKLYLSTTTLVVKNTPSSYLPATYLRLGQSAERLLFSSKRSPSHLKLPRYQAIYAYTGLGGRQPTKLPAN